MTEREQIARYLRHLSSPSLHAFTPATFALQSPKAERRPRM